MAFPINPTFSPPDMTDDEYFAAIEAICERAEKMLRQNANELRPSVKRLLHDMIDLLRTDE